MVMGEKVSGYLGIQARMFAKQKLRRESPLLTFRIIFRRSDGEVFDDYIIEAKSDHVAWTLAHMRFESDYPEEDAETYCVEVERKTD